MNTAYILLGTNLGDKISNIKTACSQISSGCGNIVKCSALYETSPWGNTEQSSFLNCVLQLDTDHTPENLLDLLLAIELQMGRVRIMKWGERIIDLDILYVGDLVRNTEKLILPHPQLHNRNFTLIPLCEIAPDFIHPLLNKTSRQLLESCQDDGIVIKTTISL